MKNNYHVIDSCKTCKHCKEIGTIDWIYYVCNLDKTYKPNKKYILEQTDDEILEGQNWLSSHEIMPNYICDDFE